MPISVTWETAHCQKKAEILIEALRAFPEITLLEYPSTAQDNTVSHLHLHFTEQRLELRDNIDNPLFIDFLDKKMQYRLKQGSQSKEQIAKAVGLKKQIKPYVLDTTAGLGRDAYILASLGCEVHLIERSPILFFLLQDGLERAAQHPNSADTVTRMQLSLGDARSLLPTTTPPDVIYLDPMYPTRAKSALNKKEMRIVRTLVGEDEDAGLLLKDALTHAKHRVVVKRPTSGMPLQGPNPNFAIRGKTNRYDVYVINNTHAKNMYLNLKY